MFSVRVLARNAGANAVRWNGRIGNFRQLSTANKQISKDAYKMVLGAGMLVAGATAFMNRAALTDAAEDGSKDKSKKTVMTSSFTFFSAQKLSDPEDVKVFSGSGNPDLAKSVAGFLGVELGSINVGRFADGEVSIKVNENVRGKHVILVQSCAPPNLNDCFVELLFMVSTMRRSSAKTITVVMPYVPYGRSDTKTDTRCPIAARDTMEMLETMGMDRLVAIDMHSGQQQGFLSPSVPSDNITAIKVGALYFAEMKDLSETNLVVVAPNAKAVPRTKDFWNVLIQKGFPQARFAMVLRQPNLEQQNRKTKMALKAGVAASIIPQKTIQGEEYEVVGDDNIQGSDAIIVQDIIDSAESLCKAAESLKKNGAKRVFVFATHGLFSAQAAERITGSCIDKVLVSNTVSCEKPGLSDKIEWISVAPLLAETIRRICEKESLSPLFKLPTGQ